MEAYMATMKDIITSPLLLIMVIIGLLYIVVFSLIYLKKAYNHCLELGITKETLKNVIKCHRTAVWYRYDSYECWYVKRLLYPPSTWKEALYECKQV